MRCCLGITCLWQHKLKAGPWYPTHHTLPYPRSDQVDDAGIVLSLESRSSEALAAACERLKGLLPARALLSEHRDSSAINSPAVGGGANGGLDPAAS